MSKERTRKIITLGAKIIELRCEADRLENELEKLLETRTEPRTTALINVPGSSNGNGNKKRKVGTGHALSEPELEAAVLRYLHHKEHASLTGLAPLVHSSPERLEKVVAKMMKSGLLAKQVMKVPVGNRTMTSERIVLGPKKGPVVAQGSL